MIEMDPGAREAFAIGRDQEALDLFGKLYAEKLHPNDLRNLGRCYQNLGDPPDTSNSFNVRPCFRSGTPGCRRWPGTTGDVSQDESPLGDCLALTGGGSPRAAQVRREASAPKNAEPAAGILCPGRFARFFQSFQRVRQ